MDNQNITPEAFKQRIVTKYPNGVSSDGRKYADIDASELTQKVVGKYPDAQTNDGISYKSFLGTQTEPKSNNNPAQSLFTNLIGRPAVRLGQAVGSLAINAFGNEEQKAKAQQLSQQPVKLPLGLGTVEGQKPFGEGGEGQIVSDTLKSGFDIATLGGGSAVNTTLKEAGEQLLSKTLPSLAKSKVGKFVAQTGANLLEGEGYNTGYNLLNNKPAFENARTAGALSVGLPPLLAGALKLPSLIPKSESILNRVARLSPSDAQKFKNLAGETHGSYLERTGNFGNPQQIVEKEAQKFTESLNQVDTALESLPGTYQNQYLKTALEDLAEREARIGVASEETARIKQLANKHETQGLTMKESNEVKRLYERNVKLDFVRQNLPEGVARATRIDDGLRQWQFGQAEKLGLKNLPALNKQTQLSRFIVDKLGKQISGRTGNEALNLTDWIVLSGGDPTAITAFLTKKTLSSKKVQASIASLLSKKSPTGTITAEFGGKQGLPALIPGRNYATEIPNNPKYQTIALPQSARETNLGLNEVKGATRSKPELPLLPERLPKKALPKTIPQEEPYVSPDNLPTIQVGDTPVSKYKKPQSGLPTIKGATTIGALTAGATGLGAVGALSRPSTTTYTASPDNTLKSIPPEKLGDTLSQLESSGGRDKSSADTGEKKWLTGLTLAAINELKRLGIKKSVKINDEDDVKDASIKYFNLMKQRHPNLSDAEIYVDWYWGGAKNEAQRQKKIEQFNNLINT